MMDATKSVVVAWAGFAFVLNLIREIAFAIAHCTAGDVMIAVTSFMIGRIATHRADGPLARPLLGGAAATLFGLAYTAFSEWRNVYGTGSWSYAPAMPLLFGIGLAPLLQWLVIPPLCIAWLRKRRIAL